METSTKEDPLESFDEDDDFCLADTLVGMSDEEIERMAEQAAENEVSSCALSGIPLDKATLKAGLIVSYQQVRAERTARQQPPPATASMTTQADSSEANAAHSTEPQPDKDVAMTYEVVETGYRHLFGAYLTLATHFEKHGPEEEAARYSAEFDKYHEQEMELYRLTPAEMWTHKTEVLPPLIAEAQALQKKYLGYQAQAAPGEPTATNQTPR